MYLFNTLGSSSRNSLVLGLDKYWSHSVTCLHSDPVGTIPTPWGPFRPCGVHSDAGGAFRPMDETKFCGLDRV